MAKSADVPGMAAASLNIDGLREAIEEAISRYFHSIGEPVHVTQSTGRGRGDLSTWQVSEAPPKWLQYREAAE